MVLNRAILLAGMLFTTLAMASCHAEMEDVELSNGYCKLTVRGTAIVGLQVDPRGRNPRSLNFIKDLRPEFWRETPETRVTLTATSAVISPLEIWEYRGIATNVGTDRPDKLEPGHTLGQTLNVPSGAKLSSIEVRLPTWGSKKSCATLSLFHGGKLLTSRRLKNVQDNSWQKIDVGSGGSDGTYTVQVSDPVGDIGWWSSENDTNSIGEALVDGKPVPGDHAIQVHTYRLVGTGDLNLSLEKNKLRVNAEFRPTEDIAHKTFPWRWRTTWTRSGYDCTPKAGVVFSRFFTDNQRYMPVQQLKRRDHGGLAFDGFRRLEMDGTRDADLCLESGNMHLHWELRPNEMHLRFDTPLERTGDVCKSGFTLTINPRDDTVPDAFPRFLCSDKAVEADVNRFWWERGFSYGFPPNRSAEWMEWTELTRTWFEDSHAPAREKQLLEYPITDEGYVHTYGDIIGWPLVPKRDTRHFDTNARFILACWRHYLWTGDVEFLKKQTDRLRKAMRYQLQVLHGSDGLIVTPEMKTGRHEDLSNNYWDILPFGHLDAYANTVFYGSLEAMAEMEEALGISDVGLRIPDLGAETPSFYRSLAERSHKAYDETFWDEAKGRYVGCVDSDGVKHDYGFTFVNLEALFYGLGDAEKARRIYHWMETERTSSGKADTYSRWIFAPRSSTVHNPRWKEDASHEELNGEIKPWWTYWWRGTRYGDQCQDGGAILYVSFFDLMDRVRYRDADNAWQRFNEILDRYRMPDRLCGGSPLYRHEKSQQEGAGSVGVDYPFPESGLVPLYFLYGVMGVEATADGLRIAPRLPSALTYAEVRHVSWHGMRLAIRVTGSSITITGTATDDKPFSRGYRLKPGSSVLFTGP